MAKKNLKNQAIKLRKLGKSYSEILQEVCVAKSTLSLWLRSVGLSKKQKQRLTLKKIEAAIRGGEAKRRQRILKTNKIIEKARSEVKKITKRELWIAGTMLYWSEGKKEKEYRPGTGLIFCNSDHLMINVYLCWLRTCLHIPKSKIMFSIYIHETHKRRVEEIRSFWSQETGFPIRFFKKVYFKKNKLNSKRKNRGVEYRGLLNVGVRRSSDLNRRVTGWIKGVAIKCRVV